MPSVAFFRLTARSVLCVCMERNSLPIVPGTDNSHNRQHRLDGNPFFVGEFVAHDSAPSVRALNHGSVVRLNGAPTDWDLVAMRPEADALRSTLILSFVVPECTS